MINYKGLYCAKEEGEEVVRFSPYPFVEYCILFISDMIIKMYKRINTEQIIFSRELQVGYVYAQCMKKSKIRYKSSIRRKIKSI